MAWLCELAERPGSSPYSKDLNRLAVKEKACPRLVREPKDRSDGTGKWPAEMIVKVPSKRIDGYFTVDEDYLYIAEDKRDVIAEKGLDAALHHTSFSILNVGVCLDAIMISQDITYTLVVDYIDIVQKA